MKAKRIALMLTLCTLIETKVLADYSGNNQGSNASTTTKTNPKGHANSEQIDPVDKLTDF